MPYTKLLIPHMENGNKIKTHIAECYITFLVMGKNMEIALALFKKGNKGSYFQINAIKPIYQLATRWFEILCTQYFFFPTDSNAPGGGGPTGL